MTIHSINLAMAASYGAYNQKLTKATKEKLEELGIPFDKNITEQAGKALLLKAQNSNNNQTNTGYSSSNYLFEKAKKLAEKLNVKVPEGINFNELLTLLETKLKEKITANQNDITALKELKSISDELMTLEAQVNGSQKYDANQALLKSLDMLSEYNKNYFRN